MPPSTVPHMDDLDPLRADYDRVADRYVDLGVGDLSGEPWLRAVLSGFAEQVRGPVLDVGCGPGQVSAFLAERGVQVSGIDLSPRMVALARQRFPELRFEVGSATDLGVPAGSLGGVLGWWSLFHLPRVRMLSVFEGFARALVPGGLVLVGFHVGAGDLHRTEAYGGVPVGWTTHLWQPGDLRELLAEAGLVPVTELRFESRGVPQVVIAATHG